LLWKYFKSTDEKSLQQAKEDPSAWQVVQGFEAEERLLIYKIHRTIFNELQKRFGKKLVLHEGNDIDKEGCLFLLHLCHFIESDDIKVLVKNGQAKEIKPGQKCDEGMMIDL